MVLAVRTYVAGFEVSVLVLVLSVDVLLATLIFCWFDCISAMSFKMDGPSILHDSVTDRTQAFRYSRLDTVDQQSINTGNMMTVHNFAVSWQRYYCRLFTVLKLPSFGTVLHDAGVRFCAQSSLSCMSSK